MAITRPRRYTVADWERLIEDGVLDEDERVELIRGEIVAMSPIGGPHITAIQALTHHLVHQVGNRARVSVQNPIRLPGDSEPQPDIVIVRAKRYRSSPPHVADVFLVIEVADSSLSYDRTTKLPLYAAAGIPEAWIFDLIAARIGRHTGPGPDGYRQVAAAERGQTMVSTVLPGIALSIDDADEPGE